MSQLTQFFLSLTLLPTPAPLRAPAHRAQRGVCVPPASRHLEKERDQPVRGWLLCDSE